MRTERDEASFKAEAVKLGLSTDQSYADLAQDLGVKYTTLHNWIYKAMNETKNTTKDLKQSQEGSAKPLSKSDYQSLEREPVNDELDQRIGRIYAQHNRCYGYRRVREGLLDLGVRASQERVRRRMKGLNLRGLQKRKFEQTTDSDHSFMVMPNVLSQDFETHLPNTKWVGDITYIQVKQRWLYLAVVIDFYSRRVVGWAFSERINTQLVCDAVKMVLRKKSYPKGVVVHTDRGSQYCSGA